MDWTWNSWSESAREYPTPSPQKQAMMKVMLVWKWCKRDCDAVIRRSQELSNIHISDTIHVVMLVWKWHRGVWRMGARHSDTGPSDPPTQGYIPHIELIRHSIFQRKHLMIWRPCESDVAMTGSSGPTYPGIIPYHTDPPSPSCPPRLIGAKITIALHQHPATFSIITLSQYHIITLSPLHYTNNPVPHHLLRCGTSTWKCHWLLWPTKCPGD